MFQPLNREEVKQIVRIQFEGLKDLLKQNNMTITATEEAIEWLSQLGFDPQFGARPLKRVIQKKVLNELSKQILAGKIVKDAEIELRLNKKNEFEFVNLAKSMVF